MQSRKEKAMRDAKYPASAVPTCRKMQAKFCLRYHGASLIAWRSGEPMGNECGGNHECEG